MGLFGHPYLLLDITPVFATLFTESKPNQGKSLYYRVKSRNYRDKNRYYRDKSRKNGNKSTCGPNTLPYIIYNSSLIYVWLFEHMKFEPLYHYI